MRLKNKVAAVFIAAVTFGSGLSALPAANAGLLTADAVTYNSTSYKAPAVKSVYTSTDKEITIGWDSVGGAAGYYIYRWSANAPTWVRVGTAPAISTSFTDKRVGASMSYKYYVVAYKKSGNKRIMSGKSDEISASTLPSKPELFDNPLLDNNYMTVYWNEVKCAGYEVYYQQGSGDWKLVSTVNSSDTNYCDIKGLKSETKYNVKVRAFGKDANGKTLYGEYSDAKTFKTAPDFLFRRSSQHLIDRLDSAKIDPGQTSYYLYDRQTANESKTSVQINEADIATIKRFADAHLTSDMTPGEKVDYTIQWLNKNVIYADGKEGRPEYSVLTSRSNVDNCFNHKVGQCLQYNSALCAVMRYLGYDARVVKGWKGRSLDDKWQHFWVEVTINGKEYVCDTYNFSKDGDWYIVCASYEETAPYSYQTHYIMNNKLMCPFRGYSYGR